MEISINTLIDDENFYNFGGTDSFSLNGYKCFAGIDINHISPYEVKKTLKLQVYEDEPIQYAFGSSTGLCTTTPTGSIKEKDLLTKLMSLSDDDESVCSFFKEYGFLFPVKTGIYDEYDFQSISAILQHLKATVLLISELQSTNPNFIDILNYTLFLLLSDPIEVTISATGKIYHTCHHKIAETIKKASFLPETDRRKEVLNSGCYKVKDLIYPPYYDVDPNEYKNIRSTFGRNTLPKGWNTSLFKDIVSLYVNDINEPIGVRLIIDFLYHFMIEVGVIKSVDFYSGVSFYEEDLQINLTASMKKALVYIAKIALNEEINANLAGITSRFVVSKMEPSWRATNLLSALYFSIFYTNPKAEIYRKCANPACNNRFLVKTSNGRKKYCCPSCRNATAQRNHRVKMKKIKAQ